MYLMRWQQLFPQISLYSYPFPVHLKPIFVAGASWKVVQGRMKLTLLTYVRFEEGDPLGPTSLDVHLLYSSLRGLFHVFFSSDVMLLKSETQVQHQDSSFGPHNYHLSIMQTIWCIVFLLINRSIILLAVCVTCKQLVLSSFFKQVQF